MENYKIFDEDLNCVASFDANPEELKNLDFKSPLRVRIANWAICAFFVFLIALAINMSYHSKIKGYQTEIEDLYSQMACLEQETELMSTIGYYYTQKNAEAYSDSAAWQLLQDCGAWYPDVIMAQLTLESGKFKSDIGKQANNGFGMKKANRRPTTQIPGTDHKGYGIYYNWQLSVIDRILWDDFSFSGKIPTKEEYLAKIEHIYAEDQNYLKKINKIIIK